MDRAQSALGGAVVDAMRTQKQAQRVTGEYSEMGDLMPLLLGLKRDDMLPAIFFNFST